MALAVITGAGAPGGIGMASARALGAAGFDLAITATTGRIEARRAELMAEGFRVVAFQDDLTDAATVARLYDLTGPAEVLVNNAGMGSLLSPAEQIAFLDLSPEDWRRQMDTTLTTAVLVTQAYLPAMVAAGRGRVIMMASVTGPKVSNPGEAAYSAAKAAMVGLTHALALEVAAHGVTVNAVAPGPILWPEDGQFPDAEREAIVQHTLLKRAGTPEDIARTVRFLMLDAPYITGQVINVDGGRSAHLVT